MEPSELDDWAAEAAAVVGVGLEPGAVAAVLDLARDAAHGIARPAAPVTAFIAGLAVGRGQPTAEAMAALTDAIARRAEAAGPAREGGAGTAAGGNAAGSVAAGDAAGSVAGDAAGSAAGDAERTAP